MQAAKPAQQPKKEKAAAPAPAPKKEEKAKNPLDVLPKSSMVLDDWKREYSNKDTVGPGSACEWLWKNFDAEGTRPAPSSARSIAVNHRDSYTKQRAG